MIFPSILDSSLLGEEPSNRFVWSLGVDSQWLGIFLLFLEKQIPAGEEEELQH